jgi:hypothetical protein
MTKSISSTSTSKEEMISLSICDIMKGNTSKIIKKMESQIPSYVQLFSDHYSEYLHTFDDIFGTCYLAEKEFFDKLGIDNNTLEMVDKFSTNFSNMVTSQIEMSTNLLRAYFQMRIMGIKSFDSSMHLIMDSYAKTLEGFNKVYQK